MEEINKYHYVINLGNSYICYVFSFYTTMESLDGELQADALQTMLDAMYVEIVTE